MDGPVSAILTYHPRRGVVSAVAGRKLFHLATQQRSSPVSAWEHQYEFRPGQYTLWDHAFVLPHVDNEDNTLRIRTGRSRLAAKILKYRRHHTSFGPAICIENRDAGFYIHGWPPCNLRRCIVIAYGLEALIDALLLEDQVSFRVEH